MPPTPTGLNATAKPSADAGRRGRPAPQSPEADAPLLFGEPPYLDLLVRLHREGVVHTRPGQGLSGLFAAGLIVRVFVDGHVGLALDPRHPAHAELRRLLRDLSGVRGVRPVLPARLPDVELAPDKGWAKAGMPDFRVLVRVLQSAEPLDFETLCRRIPDYWRNTIRAALARFLKAGVLVEGAGGFRLAPAVPSSFAPFVVRTAKAFAELDPRLADRPTAKGPRPVSFAPANDGAPRLFGTDARLRNLMALAVHGPLLYRELRRIVGAGHLKLENRKVAVFGRGALVRTWETDVGPALTLDPDHPVHLSLRRLLVALERVYPLPPYVPEYEAPAPPPRRKWGGDRHALFGDIIPTSILTSIGVHGWTFEALCCAVINHDRWNIKKSMRRLEDEGVLQGDRPRGPGFKTRVVTIADGFPAKRELEAVLRAYVRAWPQTATAVQRGFEKIARERPRGKAHLVKRGLWPY